MVPPMSRLDDVTLTNKTLGQMELEGGVIIGVQSQPDGQLLITAKNGDKELTMLLCGPQTTDPAVTKLRGLQ